VNTWHWETWQGLPYLTSSLLQPWPHGFFTRQFAPRNPAALVKVLAPDAPAYWTQQVHGNVIVSTKNLTLLPQAECPSPKGATVFADGLMTAQTEEAVWVCSADCTPVLIGDQALGRVAALHAGWRGTAANIVPLAIARFRIEGSQLADLRVALGPAISGAVYQVSETVAAQVGQTLMPLGITTTPAILAVLHQLSPSPLLPDPELGRVRLDIRGAIALQLLQAGLSPDQVAIAPHCTYQEAERFFSYRRTGQNQVQWSGILTYSPD